MADQSPLILVVDDDPDFVDMHGDILLGAGYRVVSAFDPEAAWAVFQREQPDLVVTDLMMSAVDSGFSLARQVAAAAGAGRRVPVIVITSVGSRRGFDFTPQGPEDLAAVGAAAIFSKPVRAKELLNTVRTLLAPEG
ncbi:MAG: response regulator [Myxococcota bacterium]|jgi:CheY-like chemotaxis protein|nr:response regulator [Myxococcota bacterium]